MQEISTQTKSSKTTLRSGAVQGVKKPFSSKKCIFWPENDVFSKKSFYSKLISDQNYIICTCQKKYFQNKIMRLQFSPDSTQLILKIACLVCCNFLLFFLGFAFQTFDLIHEFGFLDPAVTLCYRVVTSANFNVVNKFFFQCPTLIMVLFVFSLNIDNCKCLVCTQDTYMIISLKICNIALILNYLNILKCQQYLAPKKQ